MDPLRVLTMDGMEQIDQAAKSILSQTGMKIESDQALDYLEKFGCTIDRSTYIVQMPEKLTEQVVERMRKDYLRPERPERMPVRYSHVRFQPTPYQVHPDFTASTGGFCCFINDLDGNRREATRKDMLCAINMVNSLDQIDYTGLPVSQDQGEQQSFH